MIVAALFSSVMGYVLSPAMFVLLERRGMLSPTMDTVGMFFLWPLHEAYMNIPIVHDFYDGYFELMGVNP